MRSERGFPTATEYYKERALQSFTKVNTSYGLTPDRYTVDQKEAEVELLRQAQLDGIVPTFFLREEAVLYGLSITQEYLHGAYAPARRHQAEKELRYLFLPFCDPARLSEKYHYTQRIGNAEPTRVRALFAELAQAERIDQEKTERAQYSLRQWGRGSPLQYCRNQLGVTQATEKPVDIRVLKSDAQTTQQQYGWAALHLQHGPYRILVLPANYEQYGTGMLEHEYAHSQSNSGLCSPQHPLFLRGLNEATTEECVTVPQAYPGQHAVLHHLIASRAVNRSDLMQAYRGESDKRKKIVSAIVRAHGMRGLHALLLMNPAGGQAEEERFYSIAERDLFHSVRRVQDILGVPAQ